MKQFNSDHLWVTKKTDTHTFACSFFETINMGAKHTSNFASKKNINNNKRCYFKLFKYKACHTLFPVRLDFFSLLINCNFDSHKKERKYIKFKEYLNFWLFMYYSRDLKKKHIEHVVWRLSSDLWVNNPNVSHTAPTCTACRLRVAWGCWLCRWGKPETPPPPPSYQSFDSSLACTRGSVSCWHRALWPEPSAGTGPARWTAREAAIPRDWSPVAWCLSEKKKINW